MWAIAALVILGAIVVVIGVAFWKGAQVMGHLTDWVDEKDM